jgi:hypothetical protein
MKKLLLITCMIITSNASSQENQERKNFKAVSSESGVIYQLKPTFFDYGSSEKILGLNPDDVAKVSPALVIFDSNKKPSHVDSSSLQVFMLKEIQKHQEELKALRSEIETLKKKK